MQPSSTFASGEATDIVQQESSQEQPSYQESSAPEAQHPSQANDDQKPETDGEITQQPQDYLFLLAQRLKSLDKLLCNVSDTRRLFLQMVVTFGTLVEKQRVAASFLDQVWTHAHDERTSILNGKIVADIGK